MININNASTVQIESNSFKFLKPRRLVMIKLKCDICSSMSDVDMIPYNNMLNGWIICGNEKCKQQVAKSKIIANDIRNLYMAQLFGFEQDEEKHLIKIPRSNGTVSMGKVCTGLENQMMCM